MLVQKSFLLSVIKQKLMFNYQFRRYSTASVKTYSFLYDRGRCHTSRTGDFKLLSFVCMQDTLFTYNRTFFNVASSRLIPSGYPASCGDVARQLLPLLPEYLLMSCTLTCLPANPRQVTRIKNRRRIAFILVKTILAGVVLVVILIVKLYVPCIYIVQHSTL